MQKAINIKSVREKQFMTKTEPRGQSPRVLTIPYYGAVER